MISMDAEWGPAMRFKTGVVNFPKQMTMGAIQDNRIIYQFGKEVARELTRIGVHINFAPDVDVNNNVNNPVIATRSFSENKYVVSQKAYMYMLGMQSSGVMACAKHFPGHGDTNVDSHYDVPVLPFDRKRLEELEMYPFKVMINQGVQSVMIGHLVVPALDSTRNVPASLSKPIITGWLKERLGFEGLVFTDALDMKGVTKNFGSGQIEVKALLAGVDVLLLPENVEVAVKAIKAALKSGALTEERINESVKKFLKLNIDSDLHLPLIFQTKILHQIFIQAKRERSSKK
ncbi:glycoside hydrolase family 3 N-terminal domain-containing protein [Candidatus Brachybacter algidus]|uniref:glycoside hydrolase family 3 protein n=1 Tax=Candidatus Brachybacter algidus TaxID=2982024 RepID=UPI00257E80A8|nr:glycoside hydrolase family 3 N-terminal domain-containing protein [Candidatus Brachybacter algidus]